MAYRYVVESAVGLLLFLPLLLIAPIATGAGVVELRKSHRDPLRFALSVVLVVAAGYATLGEAHQILFH